MASTVVWWMLFSPFHVENTVSRVAEGESNLFYEAVSQK